MSCFVDYVSFKGIWRGFLFIIAVAFSFATGQRGVSLLVLFQLFLIYASAYNLRTIVIPVLMSAVLVPAALLVASFRGGNDITQETINFEDMVSEFLYGNQFSDIRDFAWILSGFDGNYLWGKTYFAGYTPFVPAFLSEFRQQWGWGRWSTEVAGLDPLLHGGLRSGLFSEAYFNFGPVFMTILAILFGLFLGRLTAWECQPASPGNSFRERLYVGFATYVIMAISINIVFTPSFFESLIYTGILLLS